MVNFLYSCNVSLNVTAGNLTISLDQKAYLICWEWILFNTFHDVFHKCNILCYSCLISLILWVSKSQFSDQALISTGRTLLLLVVWYWILVWATDISKSFSLAVFLGNRWSNLSASEALVYISQHCETSSLPSGLVQSFHLPTQCCPVAYTILPLHKRSRITRMKVSLRFRRVYRLW